jgi:integrase
MSDFLPIHVAPSKGPLKTVRDESAGFPSHLLGMDDGEFIAAMLQLRDGQREGIETATDLQMVNQWLKVCSPTGSTETVASYRRHIDRFRRFLRTWNELGPLEQTREQLLAPGDPQAVDAFATTLREQTATMRPDGKPLLAVSSYNLVVGVVSSFYKWACQPNRRPWTGIYTTPVTAGLQMPKRQPKPRSIDQEQLAAVYLGARSAKTSRNRPRDEIIMRLLFRTGCRASEFVRLKWSDIEQSPHGPCLHIRPEIAKGKRERRIWIDQKILDLLDEIKLHQPESEWLFPSPTTPRKHLTRQGLWQISKRAGKQAGVDRVHPHLFRHSHATIGYRNTKDVKLVQVSLGHANPEVTLSMYVSESDGDSSAKHLD